MLKRADVLISEEEIERQYRFMDAVRVLNQTFAEASGRQRTCFTATYGCQQNENDTERINGMLLKMGFAFVGSAAEADFVLLNTCAVREHAEQKVFGVLGSYVGLTRKKTDMIIAVCGCMAGQAGIADTIRKSYRHISLVFNPHALYRFAENLYKVLTTRERVFDVAEQNGNIAEGLPVRREGALKAWVSVMYGCNNFCTYCIVPYVRGRERSRDPSVVLDEVKGLVAQGYKDITLLGQNVNSYCNDLDIPYDFSDLLRDVCAIEGDFRVKFMTSHPKDATKKLFDTIAKNDKICKRIHLPFQSGSDSILKKMNRRYTREAYLDLVRYAKSVVPDLCLTSDVIVGFPGETEEDFSDTLSLIEQVGFNGLYSFLYSPRPGTPAAEMENQIDKEVKAERFNRLLALQNRFSEGCNERYVGKDLSVLVYGPSETREGMLEARTQNDTLVQIPADGKVKAGDTVTVHIIKAQNWAIFGEKQ